MALPIFKMATIGLLPSPLKKMYYRMRGAKIGKNVSLGLLSVLIPMFVLKYAIELEQLPRIGGGKCR
jgi:hypothetical protein